MLSPVLRDLAGRHSAPLRRHSPQVGFAWSHFRFKRKQRVQAMSLCLSGRDMREHGELKEESAGGGWRFLDRVDIDKKVFGLLPKPKLMHTR